MPVHTEKRPMPHAPEQMFDLVADVARYPEFLPWCAATRIKSRGDDWFVADMVIGFKAFRERFTSHVYLVPSERIEVAYRDGPFKYLTNHWIFEPGPDGTCVVDFHVDFEFRSKVLQKAIGVVFGEAVNKMVGAFEKRAAKLYDGR